MTNKILKIEEFETNDFVYDIENPDGNYVCGTNEIVVQQSDSQYNKFAAKGDVKYGDSVMPNTPILVRNKDRINFAMIKDLSETNWKDYRNFKPLDTDRFCKEQSTTSLEVWDGEKWCGIRKVIRHKVDKKIYSVLTYTGYVEVTEDHSLLDEQKEKIKPKDLKIGNKLFFGYPVNQMGNCPSFKDIVDFVPRNMQEKKAFIFGLFYSNGHCGLKSSWVLNKKDKKLLEKYKMYFEEIHYTEFKILENSNTYKLIPKDNVKRITDEYRLHCYADQYKIVPEFILNDTNIHLAFFSGCYAGNDSNIEKAHINLTNKGKIGTSGLFYIMRSLNLKTSMKSISDKPGVFQLSGSKSMRKKPNEIMKIEETDLKPEYVYDLETDSGRFQAGIGTMVVKNTDSIYTKFVFPDDDELSKEEKLIRTWDLASECADRISFTFKKPIELEMEKIMWPLYLYGKKRYACKVYEQKKDGTFESKRDLKGIQAIRRDNCKLVKSICTPVFDQLLDNNSIQGAIDVIKQYTISLFENQLNIEEFVISKSINSKYKAIENVKDYINGVINIKEDFVKINGRKQSIPGHVILAKKMIKRKVMNPPRLGDRIQFAYIEVADKKAKGSERMEDPKYIMENPDKCKLDPLFYMEKQISSPMYTIFEVLVKNENGELYPRKETVDKKTGKITTAISKDCKLAIDELIWNEIIKKYSPGTNFFIKKKKTPKVDKKQTKITDMFKKK